MECNKDEALRAKSIAESKLEQKDFAGSKKFALKAQNLYPGLDGISQMLTTLDVFVSAEKKIGGLTDYYSVLGVGPLADDDTIKKQYRKLALLLHPDKNNSAGAEGAFKLISEAWSLLSDKDKRSIYNQTMGFNFKGFQPKTPINTTGPSMAHTASPGPVTTQAAGSGSATHAAWAQAGGPSPYTVPQPEPSMESPLSKFAKRKPPAPKAPKKRAKSSPAGRSKADPAPPVQTVESFWTICGQCKIQYEYHEKYRNTTLLCPTCKMPFVAAEIPRPVTKSKSQKANPCPPAGQQQQNPSKSQKANPYPPAGQQQQNPSKSQKANPCPPAGLQQQNPSKSQKANPCSLAGQQQQNPNPNPNYNSSAPSPANNDRGKNIVPEAQNPGAGQPGPNIFLNSAHQRVPPPTTSSGVDRAANPSPATKVPKPERKFKQTVCAESKATARSEKYSKKRKFDDYKMPNGDFNFARNLNMPNAGNTGPLYQEMNATTLQKILMENARKEILYKLNESYPESPVDKLNSNMTAKKDNGQTQKSQKKSNGNLSAADSANEQNTETLKMMHVPDPDFYDFDQDRTERSFTDSDVWAAYDDDDGMPRFYALVHQVISKKPFRLKISWLNSKTTTEFGLGLDWVGSGFYKTCGEFRVGKHEVCKFVNAFSHRVKWSKGPRGAVVILPQKGDVWALYRNWSSNWDAHTPDDIIHKYDMVIVVDGYDEEKGEVLVAPLVKIVGYRTVFRPNMGDGAVLRIPKGEIFRFSHALPHHELTGHNSLDLPRGCVELDPAATPMELLGTGKDNEDVGPSGVNHETGPVKNETSQGEGKGGIGTYIDSRI